jgi:hypothetical protein
VNAVALLLGAAFGFLLSRSGVTDYAVMQDFFRFRDFHVGGVMVVAIGVAAAGLFVLRRSGIRSVAGGPIDIVAKGARKGLFASALVFGAGWGLTGT